METTESPAPRAAPGIPDNPDGTARVRSVDEGAWRLVLDALPAMRDHYAIVMDRARRAGAWDAEMEACIGFLDAGGSILQLCSDEFNAATRHLTLEEYYRQRGEIMAGTRGGYDAKPRGTADVTRRRPPQAQQAGPPRSREAAARALLGAMGALDRAAVNERPALLEWAVRVPAREATRAGWDLRSVSELLAEGAASAGIDATLARAIIAAELVTP